MVDCGGEIEENVIWLRWPWNDVSLLYSKNNNWSPHALHAQVLLAFHRLFLGVFFFSFYNGRKSFWISTRKRAIPVPDTSESDGVVIIRRPRPLSHDCPIDEWAVARDSINEPEFTRVSHIRCRSLWSVTFRQRFPTCFGFRTIKISPLVFTLENPPKFPCRSSTMIFPTRFPAIFRF